MKITKQGTPPSDKVWVGKCHSCNSEAEAVQSEMNHISYARDGSSFSWEKCPVCGANNSGSGMLFYPKIDW